MTAGLEGLFIVCFTAILFLLPLHAFLSTWLGTTIGPLLVWKSWKEIVLVGLLPLIAVYLVRCPGIARLLWSHLINKVVAVYFLLHLGCAVFSQASIEAVGAGLLIDLRFLGIFLLAQLIVASNHPWIVRLKAWLPVWLLGVMLGLGGLALLQVTALPSDFLSHFGYSQDTTIAPITVIDDTNGALRAQATMRGPNALGQFLLIPLAFAVLFIRRKQALLLSASALVLGVIALGLTGSRSAWLGCLAMMAALVCLYAPMSRLLFWAKRTAIPVALVAGTLLVASITIAPLRLAIFHSSPGDPSLFEGSTEQHWQAIVNGLNYVVVHPLGTGPGSAGPASFYNHNAPPLISENYFIQVAQEVGIIGLLLFLTICCLVARQLFRTNTTESKLLLASFIGLSLVNLLLHGWADDPTAMVWWGLAGLMIGTPKTSN